MYNTINCNSLFYPTKVTPGKGRPKKQVAVKVNVKVPVTPGPPKTAAFQCTQCTCFFTVSSTLEYSFTDLIF